MAFLKGQDTKVFLDGQEIPGITNVEVNQSDYTYRTCATWGSSMPIAASIDTSFTIKYVASMAGRTIADLKPGQRGNLTISYDSDHTASSDSVMVSSHTIESPCDGLVRGTIVLEADENFIWTAVEPEIVDKVDLEKEPDMMNRTVYKVFVVSQTPEGEELVDEFGPYVHESAYALVAQVALEHHDAEVFMDPKLIKRILVEAQSKETVDKS